MRSRGKGVPSILASRTAGVRGSAGLARQDELGVDLRCTKSWPVRARDFLLLEVEAMLMTDRERLTSCCNGARSARRPSEGRPLLTMLEGRFLRHARPGSTSPALLTPAETSAA